MMALYDNFIYFIVSNLIFSGFVICIPDFLDCGVIDTMTYLIDGSFAGFL